MKTFNTILQNMHERSAIFAGTEISQLLERLKVTHIIWIPDSSTGRWETALENNASFRLVRICREGEAWPLAAGLLLGGQKPIVIMQSTGFFESGDALRNVWKDLQLPVFAIIGARNWLTDASRDSAKQFLLPLLQAWEVDYSIVESSEDLEKIAAGYERAVRERRPGVVVLAEGKG